MALDMRTALTQIEVALKNNLLQSFGKRISPSAATITALKAFPSKDLKGDELYYVTSKGLVYQFSRDSSVADDGNLTIQPADLPTTGRWLQTSNTTVTGYARQVRVHLGDESYQSFLKRGIAARPSIHIVYDGTRQIERSLSRGALYMMISSYRIVCISSSFRFAAQAIEGSDIPSEFANDPGTHDMIGDVNTLLAGFDLGLSSIGVQYCLPTSEKFKTAEIGGRLFIEEQSYNVYYSVHQPDTGVGTVIDSLSGITVQRQLVGGMQPLDPLNYVSSGLTTPTGASLTQTITAGSAFIAGNPVSVNATSHTFGANVDTYRDLTPSGSWLFVAVPHGQSPASPQAGAMRIGVTVTDGANVIWDSRIASSKVNYGPVDIVPGAGLGVSSIAITPASATVSLSSGPTAQFTATATYTDGSTKNISTAVTWSSSSTSVATVNYAGLSTGLTVGTSTISCSLDGLASSNTPTLTVNA